MVSQMKIYGIYLVDKIVTGGNRRYIELLTSIARKGISVTVFVNEIFKDEFIGCNTEAIPIKLKKNKRISVQTAKQLELFIKQNKERLFSKELLKAKDSYILIFGETDWLSGNVLKNFCEAKIVFAYRSDIIEEIASFFKYEKLDIKKRIFFTLKYLITRYREKMIAKKASLITFQTTNDETHFKLRNRKIKSKTVVIPNDILQLRFKKEYKDKNESKNCNNILFVGSYDIRKGLIFFLKALVIVKESNISFNSTIVCRGDVPITILNFIKDYNLEKNVTFIKDASDSLPIMIRHDLLIVPSLFDSFPNVIMEALHVGLPIFASNTSGIPYMIQNKKLLFEVANPNDIAKKLIECLINNGHYLDIKKDCHAEREKFEFDWAERWILDMNNT